jgi:cobalt/nickel transport system permease protein
VPGDLFARYHHRVSVIHRCPAAFKLGAAMVVVLGIVVTPRGAWKVHAGLGAGLVVVGLLSRVPAVALLRRLAWVEPFALSVAVLAWFQPHGGMIFLATLCKSTLALATMVLLGATTRFTDLLEVLHRARLPSLLVTTIALTQRYLHVCIEESRRLQRARRSRTFRVGREPAWRAGASVIALLFVRASERAERVAAAMLARGWKP